MRLGHIEYRQGRRARRWAGVARDDCEVVVAGDGDKGGDVEEMTKLCGYIKRSIAALVSISSSSSPLTITTAPHDSVSSSV